MFYLLAFAIFAACTYWLARRRYWGVAIGSGIVAGIILFMFAMRGG